MKLHVLFLILTTLCLPLAYASNHAHSHENCECSKECKENCSKGKTEACECKDCECKEEKACH